MLAQGRLVMIEALQMVIILGPAIGLGLWQMVRGE
jgi:hypothetical protein